jgi:hypothetical protein
LRVQVDSAEQCRRRVLQLFWITAGLVAKVRQGTTCYQSSARQDLGRAVSILVFNWLFREGERRGVSQSKDVNGGYPTAYVNDLFQQEAVRACCVTEAKAYWWNPLLTAKLEDRLKMLPIEDVTGTSRTLNRKQLQKSVSNYF